jgi:FkbM family methyltransferase
MSSSPSPVDPRQFFRLEQLPDNVRLQRWCEAMRLTRWGREFHRRLLNWAWGTRRCTGEGRFIYRREGKDYPIVFNGRNHQFHAVYEEFYRHGYEPETSHLIARLLPQVSGTFIDVGANWGYYSLLAGAVSGYTGEIHAFEPSPRVHADLVSVIQQAGLAGRITPHAKGVGAEPAELVLEEADAFRTGLGRLTSTGSGVRVPVQRLDDSGIPSPAVIKIDAEGMEHAVLTGAREMISKASPFIVFESFIDLAHPEQTQLPFEFLSNLGYRFFVPTLLFERAGRLAIATYADNVSALLAETGEAKSGLAEIGRLSRFIAKSHLNVLAVHQDKVPTLWRSGIVNLDELFANEPGRPQ